MTFRPSDDVLEEMENDKQSYSPSTDQYDVWNQWDWQHIFGSENNSENQLVNQSEDTNNSVILDSPVEEVKAPDLSELLGNDENKTVNNIEEEKIETFSEQKVENSEAQWDAVVKVDSVDENPSNQEVVNDMQNDNSNEQSDSELDGFHEISDKDRSEFISEMNGGVNSELDFLIDKQWVEIVEKYKKIHRLVFRWGIFIFAIIVGIASWTMIQVKSDNSDVAMVGETSIDKRWWRNELSDEKLSSLINSGVDMKTIIPYGYVSQDWTTFQTKGNLISYKWIILPQLASVNYLSEDFFPLDDFNNKETTREDLENLINSLVKDSSIYRRTTDLPNIYDSRWDGNTFQWSLMDGFSLNCLYNDKVSDFVCDKFLKSFYNYGKYFDLSKYSSEVLSLTRELKKQWRDIAPICTMIKEYTLRAGTISDTLNSVMQYCSSEDYNYYRKLLSFIDVENSLLQPELSDKVFDDPDLNAYKLLSAWQSVYKILDGTSLNENYIKSYLDFVQSLINKDKNDNRYISPVYKDLLYVFNMDELYKKVMEKWKSDLKIQIDQINNWNLIYGYPPLLSQLTTSGIVKVDVEFTGSIVAERTLDEIFSQYYLMTDRLKIRNAIKTSEDTIRVQTELFTEKIKNVTNGETLKLTTVLHREGNVLYVDSIKVANQQKFTDILTIRCNSEKVSFYEMLNYIDEQVWMRYIDIEQNPEWETDFCDDVRKIEDVTVYSCDDTSLLLYKWNVEYSFSLINWVLQSFKVSDESANKTMNDKLKWTIFTKSNTLVIIKSIVWFDISKKDDSTDTKLEIIDQFRIHFKLIPKDIIDIDWKSDEFLVEFNLWQINLQANYNVNTQTLTKIYFVDCEKTLEIRNLSIQVNGDNEAQLMEIKNNPGVFFARSNPSAYKKYQTMCDDKNWKVKKAS